MRATIHDLKQGHTLLSYLKARYTARRAAKGMRPLAAMPDAREVVTAQKATLAMLRADNERDEEIYGKKTLGFSTNTNLWADLEIE
jgi:hypothetical protein